jgi:hypothetical protein
VFNATYGRYILSTWGGQANMLNLFEAPAAWGNTSYTLSAWVKTSSNNNAGSLSVRAGAGGAIMSQIQFGSRPSYTLLSTTFNSGSRSSVEIAVSMVASATTTSVWVDDVLIQ